MAGSYPLPAWMDVLRRVSVVMPAGNDLAALAKSLEELKATKFPWREIVVVDPGIDSVSLGRLSEDYPKVELIDGAGVKGSGHENLGMQKAQGDWIFVLRPGASPDAGTWEGLCQILRTEPDADIISLSLLGHHRETLRQLNRASLVDSGNFKRTGFFVKRTSFANLGGFDEELPESHSEMHWSARIIREGGNVLHCPEAGVILSSEHVELPAQHLAHDTCCNSLLLVLRFAPSQSWRRLLRRQIGDILTYTFLHRTPIYLKALLKARSLWHAHPSKISRMSQVQFNQLSLDPGRPFGFLG